MKGLFSKNLIARWDGALSRSKRIFIATHVNPDGDAIGAMVGLGVFLKEQGYHVTMACPTPYPEFLDFLDKDKEILIYVDRKSTRLNSSH